MNLHFISFLCTYFAKVFKSLLRSNNKLFANEMLYVTWVYGFIPGCQMSCAVVKSVECSCAVLPVQNSNSVYIQFAYVLTVSLHASDMWHINDELHRKHEGVCTCAALPQRASLQLAERLLRCNSGKWSALFYLSVCAISSSSLIYSFLKKKH